MYVTAKAEYACLAMLELAQRFHEPRPVRLAEVSEKHGIPQQFLVQILLQLKAAGLVQTTRGANGGYQLARAPDRITLADILSVLDGMDEPEVKVMQHSSLAGGLQRIWKQLAEERMQLLQKVKLSDLLPSSLVSDYTI